MGVMGDLAGRDGARRRRWGARAALLALLVALILAGGGAIWVGQSGQAPSVPAAEADRVVRLVGRTPWFTNEMIDAQDSTISYAGMALHARVIGARITPDVVWLMVQQTSGSGGKPAPVATVTLISDAPVHGQSYALISMAQGSIEHRVEREGAGYRVTFWQDWGRTPCAYHGPARSTICALPLFSHAYRWQLVYHVRGTRVSHGAFSTDYDGS